MLEASTHALPGVQHAAVTVLERGGSCRTMASTGDLPRHFDDLQLRLDEGPLIDVVRDKCPIEVLCGPRTGRWPRFVEHAEPLGLRSALTA